MSPASDELFRKYFEEAIAKTSETVGPLYRLDAIDWTVLAVYFTILTVLALYGMYRIKQVFDFWRYRRLQPEPRRRGSLGEAT